ncbi:TraI domain-containing protein [Pseudomonas sp. GD03721]|nr:MULTISPECIES: MobH family relaxase [unclassified Pseudomonas]MDH1440405.1 TraI domain-containing protein [Pseudomonas sp. GD03722]WGG03507.1 TraI domain-containing protein [Pseudomonas sp. GD03721]WGG07675.1 TraI domain-containing protein [Pseudomonas sp. GD03919]
MLRLFRIKPQKAAPPPEPLPESYTPVESAHDLLQPAHRQQLLARIWELTALSHPQFQQLYLNPIQRYAQWVQQLPASEAHHHAYHGGMLDHGLELVAYSLKLRQSYLLPTGAAPEDQAAQADAWSAGIAYGALLHDIGKIAVDLRIERQDGSLWHPWHGPLDQPYRFRYSKGRDYKLHGAAAGLLYTQILDRDLLDWLSTFPALWGHLLHLLAGQYEHAGILGELVIHADRASVAQSLGGDPARAMTAPTHSLQRKLLDGLRYLLKAELKLNQAGPSDGWLTQDALWLVSKTVSDKLRAHLLAQGIDGIPSSNTSLFNVLQDHGMLQPSPDGRAIWRATITSETGWSHTFTLLRLTPALIWEADDRPASFAGTVVVEPEAKDEAEALPATDTDDAPAATTTPAPAETPAADSVDALLGLLGTAGPKPILQAPIDAPVPTPDRLSCSNSEGSREPPSGEHFMAWLKQRIQSHKLIINDAKALVHSVADTAFLVSPGVFQRYAREHLQTATLAKQDQIADWQWVQRRFEKLQLHRKQDSGLNIWTCEVTGPRKSRQLHGYLLADPRHLFEEVPPNNPYLLLTFVGSNTRRQRNASAETEPQFQLPALPDEIIPKSVGVCRR